MNHTAYAAGTDGEEKDILSILTILNVSDPINRTFFNISDSNIWTVAGNDTLVISHNSSPIWLFGALLALVLLFAGLMSFFILTYYRKMMFAEFALAAINWRRSTVKTEMDMESWSSGSYLSVLSVLPGEHDDDTFTTSSSFGDGDDSGYGQSVMIDETNANGKLPWYYRAVQERSRIFGNWRYAIRRGGIDDVTVIDEYI